MHDRRRSLAWLTPGDAHREGRMMCRACNNEIRATPDSPNQIRVWFRCGNLLCDEYGRDAREPMWFQQYVALPVGERP